MKPFKIMFLSWHFKTPQIFLDYLRHQTPNNSGNWKEMESTTNAKEADFFIIFDGHYEKIDESRAIYFCQHPKVTGYHEDVSKSFKSYTDKKCLKAFNSDNGLNPGEWWIDYSYDQLMALKPPQKLKKAACIATYQTHNPMYAQRVKFLEALSNLENSLDLFGRPEEKYRANSKLKSLYKGSLGNNNPDGHLGNHKIGKNLLIDYKYSIEFDVGPTKNYISERFYDAMLLWCMPIYFGSTNVEEYLPRESFEYVNILDTSESEIMDICHTISSDQREINIDKIAKARDLLLNKYQAFPYIYEIIKTL